MAEKLKFEPALARLEEIVSLLETGEAPLEEAIKIFEEGIGLAKDCAKQLQAAENKLKKLVKTESGFQLDLLEMDDEST